MRKLLLALAVFSGVACGYAQGPRFPSDGGDGDTRRSIFRGQILTHEVVDGWAIAQGDIILGRADRLEPANAETLGRRSELVAIDGNNYRWPGGVIPYVVGAGVAHPDWVANAVAHVNAELGGSVRLVPRTNQADYVQFVPSTGCASYIGRIGGAQEIWLSADRCPQGAIVHEIGHALGAYHEHNRIDRDLHVRVLWANIASDAASQFEKTGESAGTDIGSYDFGSIMHYEALAGSANGLPTLETIPPGIPIGQRNGLSPGDISGFRSLYAGTAPPPTVTAPSIITQPGAASVTAGGSVLFLVTATGTAPLSYQWYREGQALAGRTAAQLTLTNVQASQAGSYWVRVSNSAGTAESAHVLLTVTGAPPPPPPPPPPSTPGTLTLGTPVTGLAGPAGTELRFTFVATAGLSNLNFQMSGGTGDADLYVDFGTPPDEGSFGCRPYLDGNDESCVDTFPTAGTYYVLIKGYTAFTGVRLVVTAGGGTGPGPGPGPGPVVTAPSIIAQPQPATVPAGSSVLFQVTASGSVPMTYQWYRDGNAISGGTSAALGLTSVQASSAGIYWVRISNSAGTVESAHVALNVTPAPAPGSGVLTNGVPVNNLGGTTGAELRFTLEVPPNSSQLSFRLSGGSGDADMYVRLGSPPNEFYYDCVSGSATNDESCMGQYPPPGTYHVLVKAYATFTGARLIASFSAQPSTPPPGGVGINLTATVDEDSSGYPEIALSWSSVVGAEYYKVYRDGTWIAITFGETLYGDSFLSPTFSHTYQVFAVFSGETIASSPLVTISR